MSDLPFHVTSLGDLLQKLCCIDDDVLLEALHRQRNTGGMLGQVLISMGVVSEADVARALDLQQSLRGVDPVEAISRLLGEQRAVRRRFNELAAFQVPPSGCGEG